MRRVTASEMQRVADLFRHGKLTHEIELDVDPVTFSVGVIDSPYFDEGWGMEVRQMAAPDGADAVRVDGHTGWLDLVIGQWHADPDNIQLVLSSNRSELSRYFGQINLNLSLTDGRTVYLVKDLSKDGGAGAIVRLYGGATGPEMAEERARRKAELVSVLGNGTITFEDEEWLIVAALPLKIPRLRRNALFTEAMAQFLRYAAHVERLRRWGAQQGEDELYSGYRLSAEERKLIELEAMAVVRKTLEEQGYQVKDVSSRASYDFEARRGQDVLYVEVKGSTTRPWCVELTAAEHRVASREGDRYSLYVVQFEGLDKLDRYEVVTVGNPLTNQKCSVVPVRYRIHMADLGVSGGA